MRITEEEKNGYFLLWKENNTAKQMYWLLSWENSIQFEKKNQIPELNKQ